jgi:hypothetical protein
VEEWPRDAERLAREGVLLGVAVARIAENRVAHRRQVRADLVRAARFERQLEEGEGKRPGRGRFDDARVRDGGFARLAIHDHLRLVPHRLVEDPQRRVDRELRA